MTRPADGQHGILVLSCVDAPGIVHAVSGLLVQEKCTIVESHQFDSLSSGMFYMRVEFKHVDGAPLDLPALRESFAETAQRFAMNWRLADAAERQRVVIMVSQYAHCLNDLLFRNSVGELNLDVVAVVSNHPTLQSTADFYGVPFTHIPVTRETKAEAEAALLDIVRSEGVELVILARYMQILSDDLCRQLGGRAINIHHSMLPSFKGARPYHQAHARGVKFIGATAHYVTADLDEGPIIEQEMLRVDHSSSPEQLAARGREAETRALAHAVRWHTENRVIIHENRTVVFE
ncbi:Formyltetrahydrofolate deformylase (Formyl-FH(4) hydrolase) [Modestobacter italicus]|uniref:Formyltetrahydrofolate deformylase n=1 Tax=Modestobacter italicus (strain DSM 44449 / CECT 9708 / BC 501) TaxID=2732864 RepID=I4EY19_MODI5|nr:formyltetrahydrofolate deformylase [Modestobacter marinus]CCH88282.1 Formyltetrahydrofolate deformylase (Formyl-FH(4) hydrolase) [Modestobacter marinus]